MSYLLEIVGRGLLAELAAAFREILVDHADMPTAELKRSAASHPTEAVHHVRLGIRALRAGRPSEALASMNTALRIDPAQVDAMLGRACALDNCGQYAGAMKQVEQAVALRPQEPAILFAMGFCQEKGGLIDEAEQNYKQALEIAPQLRNAHERLAAIDLCRSDFESAIDHYEQLCWYEPGDIDLALTLANLYLRAGRAEDAVRRFQYALTIDPDNWDAQSDLATAYEEAGLYDDAIAHLLELIEEQPGFADTHLRLADLYVRQGDLEAARTHFAAAIECNPDSIEAHVKRGTFQLREGCYLDAAATFNNAIDLNDRLLTAYVGLGVAQMEAGQHDEAMDTMTMASGVEPNSTALFSEMARLQLKASVGRQVNKYLSVPPVSAEDPDEDSTMQVTRTGDLIDEQITRHQAAIARNPHYADLHYGLGMLLRHRGHLDEAIEAFHRALEINPNYVKALIKLGLAFKERGDEDIAIDTFKRALAAQPKVVELYYQLGLMFADRGQFSLAVEQFEHAIRMDPLNVEFRANLALTLQDMGLISHAAGAWQTLCEVAPQTPRGRDVLMRISRRD